MDIKWAWNYFESWDIHLSPSFQRILSYDIQSLIHTDIMGLLEFEKIDAYIAHQRFLTWFWKRSDNSLAQESKLLYDKIFYLADRIHMSYWDNPITVHIGSHSFVRLNETIPIDWVPTIYDIRNRSHPGILLSGVGALQIHTKEWIRIPLLLRDSDAPSDAGKYTLPAGRADKSPGLTAYEEILEELTLFDKKDNELHLIVPYLTDGWISREKILQLAVIARWKYILARIRAGDISIQSLAEFTSAVPILIPLSVSQQWENILTIFHDESADMPYEIRESGFFPVYDEDMNTYEMVRWFFLNLEDYDEIISWDGDWFWRDSQLFSLTEIEKLNLRGLLVSSLNWSLELAAFN